MSRMPNEQSIVVRFAQMEPMMRGKMLELMMMFVELPDIAKRQTYTVLSNMHREMVERGIKIDRPGAKCSAMIAAVREDEHIARGDKNEA